MLQLTAVGLVECVPNVSEGRRRETIEACAQAIRAEGSRLLDVSSDPEHHRTVYTFVGDPARVAASVAALFDCAIPRIDLRRHTGVHPRFGAVDVVPFVPLEGASMADCVALAREVGADVARRHQLPVFLYEEAASTAARRGLEHIRRGQFEALSAKLAHPDWRPDFGPAAPHPSAGATAIGARPALIAYNINLATTRLDVAKRIAAVVRTSSGGLPYVKALGLALPERGIVQVSMNLTNYERTPIRRVFDLVLQEAARDGVDVQESEIVGLVPAAAMTDAAALRLSPSFSDRRILERAIASA